MSLRGLTRVFGVSRTTVSTWLREEAEALSPREETLPLAEADDVRELDELWSFVGCQARVRWLWVALCRRTRQVVAYVVGDRSEATCRRLWEQIPEDYRRALCYTDFWEAYRSVVPEEQHEPVGKESGQTNHEERWNLTLRQRLGRFVRRTLSFSKCEQMHEICLRLFVHEYNLARYPATNNRR